MGFLKKDVNLGLILLIVATLILFSGFTVYYQTNFKKVVSDYNNKLELLNNVKNELDLEKQKLNQTFELRVKAEKDIQALDSQYKGLSEERDSLETAKNNLQSELSSTKSTLALRQAELSSAKNQLAEVQAQLSVANDRVSRLNRKVDELEAKIASGSCP